MSLSLIPILFALILALSILNNRPRPLAARHALDPSSAPEATRQYARQLWLAAGVFAVLALPVWLLQWMAPGFVSLPLAWLFLWTAVWLYITEFRLAPRYLTALWAARTPSGAAPSFIHSKWKWGAPVFLTVFTAVTAIMFYFEFTPVRVNFDGSAVHIQAPFYETRFDENEIVSVTTSGGLPGGTKKNGFASDRAAFGYFDLDGIGPAELFVRHDVKPYIVVRLHNKTVIFNGRDAEETADWLARLR